MNFCYLISSHVKYSEPLQRLLKSMEYISGTRKLVSIGGWDGSPCFTMGNEVGPSIAFANHNSFDYTALIDWLPVIEKYPATTHVFLLHDTMELTPESDALIASADPEMDATAAFLGGQCNLCLFRTDYLLRQREKIMAMKNCTKVQAHDFERVLFMDAPKRTLYPNATIDILGEEPIYGGLPRRIERYNAIAALKFKASWGQDMSSIGSRVTP